MIVILYREFHLGGKKEKKKRKDHTLKQKQINWLKRDKSIAQTLSIIVKVTMAYSRRLHDSTAIQ